MTSRTSDAAPPASKRNWLKKATSVERLGQTVASVCWILSVFAYGISSSGDRLQLLAGTSWLVANLAALAADNK